MKNLQIGDEVTLKNGEKHTISAISYGDSEAEGKTPYYRWDVEWPHEIAHAAMNPSEHAIILEAHSTDVVKGHSDLPELWSVCEEGKEWYRATQIIDGKPRGLKAFVQQINGVYFWKVTRPFRNRHADTLEEAIDAAEAFISENK